MVTAFRAGKALAGALELAGKTALVALIDRRIGPVVRHVLIAVIPHVFQRLEVMLDIRVLAVANEPPVGQRRVRRFEIDLIVRVDLLLHVEVEAVGVVTFVGYPFHHAKLGGVETAEAIAQVFARRAVQAKAVAGFFLPQIDSVAQALDDGHAFLTQRLAVVHMLVAVQRIDGFMDTDIAQRNGRAAVFEDLGDVVVGFQPHAAGAFHIQDRRHASLHSFQAGDTGHQRFTRQLQALVQQRPEGGFIAFRFQGDARQVETDHAEVIASIMHLLAVLVFPYPEEAAAAHRRFKRPGDFHHLIVVEDIRVHALAGALQRQLFDVVVRVAELMVQAVADREHQFREHRGFAIFTEAGNAVAQNRLLDQPRFPAGAKAESEGDERRLAVGGMQCVDLILQRLEGVVALFFGTGAGIAFGIRDLPLFGDFAMLFEAFADERRQHFIDAVDGGAAVNMAGDLGDDLRRHRGGGRDRLRRLDLRVAHLKALGQHAFQVDQHAVEHREEGRVIEVMIVDHAALVGHHHIVGQQVLPGVVLGDDPGQQVALGRDDFTVLVGVFVEQRGVGLLDEAADLLIETAALLTLAIAVMAILNVGARQLLIGAGHQLVFHRGLDLVDVDLGAALHLLANDFCDGGAIVCVIDSRCFSCTQNCFLNAL